MKQECAFAVRYLTLTNTTNSIVTCTTSDAIVTSGNNIITTIAMANAGSFDTGTIFCVVQYCFEPTHNFNVVALFEWHSPVSLMV